LSHGAIAVPELNANPAAGKNGFDFELALVAQARYKKARPIPNAWKDRPSEILVPSGLGFGSEGEHGLKSSVKLADRNVRAVSESSPGLRDRHAAAHAL